MPTIQDLAPEPGDRPRYEDRPKRTSRSKSPSTKTDPAHGDQPQTRAQKNVRPEEVSENVWEMAGQWLDLGAAHFGRNLPVNKQNFAKRLSEKVNSDPQLGRFLRIPPERWKIHGYWESGPHFVNDVLAKALELFWKYLTREHNRESYLSNLFLDDEWDEWIYQAITAVQVAWHQKHGKWTKPDLPTAVFDPSTVGQPDPEDPCPDPEFEGMTWGEVWALDDREILAERSQEPIVRPTHRTVAMTKRASIANHHTTAKETTDD